jgi:hypothetical protein
MSSGAGTELRAQGKGAEGKEHMGQKNETVKLRE